MSQAIQLAMAPAFLLAGIGAILNVMTGRLSRIVDRGYKLAAESAQVDPENTHRRENLERRRYLASVAISACTLAALLICLVIIALFLEALLGLNLKWIVGVLFSFATLSLAVGLTYFLREVHRAMKTVRF
jgi:MFS family permease